MTRLRRALLAGGAILGAALSLELTHVTHAWAVWTDSVTVGSTKLDAHVVRPPASVSCAGGGLLMPLTYSWPSKDPRYTYRAQLVDSTGTVRRTDVVPESAKSTYSVTYAVGDLPLGDVTVQVSSFLTGATTWASSTATSGAGTKAALALGLTTTCGPS